MTRRERLETKAARRREWAEKREQRSEEAFGRARDVADSIPMGQPILVGHHSERRARRDQERIERGMAAGHEHAKMAAEHESKADGLERQLASSVYNDDADAVERLRAIVAELEAERDRIKAYNASCRKGSRDVALLDERQQQEVLSLARIGRLADNGSLPSYMLTNLGATIRQKRKRADALEREPADVDAGGRGRGKPMLSRYAGTCAVCGGAIERGQPIVWYRSTREAVHDGCS